MVSPLVSKKETIITHSMKACKHVSTHIHAFFGLKIGRCQEVVNNEVLQHVILAKKPYERRLPDAVLVLYVILVRKPRNLSSHYGLST